MRAPRSKVTAKKINELVDLPRGVMPEKLRIAWNEPGIIYIQERF